MPKSIRMISMTSAMIGIVISLILGSQVAFAANSVDTTTSQLVAVARDVTPQETCTLVHGERPIGATQFTVTKSRCPAGTFIETFFLTQSQAVAHHERYVLLPAKNASAATWAEAERQIQWLVASVPQDRKMVQPLSFCFATDKFTSATWSFSSAADGGTSTVSWHTNSDCTLYFQQNTAEVTSCGSPCNPLGWKASYYGSAVGSPYVTFNYTDGSGYCPTLNRNSTVTKYINQGNYTGNGVFWQTVVNNNGFCGPNAGATYDISFGTIS